jgi:hypothetical protein
MPDSINYSWNLACNKMYIYIHCSRMTFGQSGEKSCALFDWCASHQLLNTWDLYISSWRMKSLSRWTIKRAVLGTASSKDQACPNLYWWLRHEIGIISPTEEDTIWTKLMSIIEMKLPHPTALLHPSRIHPLASGIEVGVLSVGSMTSLQATAVSQWVLNILGWSSNNDIPWRFQKFGGGKMRRKSKFKIPPDSWNSACKKMYIVPEWCSNNLERNPVVLFD